MSSSGIQCRTYDSELDMIVSLWDTLGLWARAYFSAKNNPVQEEDLAIKIAVKMVLSLLSSESNKLDPLPTHALFLYDGIGGREKGREPKPQDYLEGVEFLQKILQQLLNVPQVTAPGEADDAIATAASKLEQDILCNTIFVLSGDKDLSQLVNNKIQYYSLVEKSTISFGNICRTWGIQHPSQVAIALAVIGDGADKIPGIRKFGPKKFNKLFKDVTPEMTLVDAADHVAKQLNEEQLNQFQECLELTLLHTDVSGIPNPEEIKINPQILYDLGWTNLAGNAEIIANS